MLKLKALGGAIAAASLVGALGLAYAQTTTDASTAAANSPSQTAPMGGAAATEPAAIPAAPAADTGTLQTAPMNSTATADAPAAPAVDNSATTSTPSTSMDNSGSTSSATASGDGADGVMVEREARADRN